MWKLSVHFTGKRNMMKQNITFTITPALGYLNGEYNNKTEHSISALWLFFEVEFNLRYEDKK